MQVLGWVHLWHSGFPQSDQTISPKCYTLQPAPYTLCPVPYTLHSIPYTLHPLPPELQFYLSSQSITPEKSKPSTLNPEP